MITIYERDATDFASNGLGTLEPVSCIVTETMNGSFEVTLTHPIDKAGKFSRIQEERIIKVPVPAGKTPRISISAAQSQSKSIYKVVTDGRRLYLRAAASQDAKGIHAYKPGTEVVVLDNTTNRQWSEVVTPDGRHGWMWTGNLEYVRTETTGTAAEEGIKEAAALREQPFRIYKVEPSLMGITAYARHIFYDLMDNMVASYKPAAGATGANAFLGLAAATEDGHGFTFYSDLESTAEDVEITDKNPAEAILDDGGLIEIYGGELQRDWWDVYLAKRIGEETKIQIREGKNLLGIKYSVDLTNAVTRVIPKGEDEDGNPLYLPGRYRENEAEEKPVYVNHKYGIIEVKEAKVKTKGEDKRTEDECIELMEKAAKEAFEAGCDLADVTLNVDFIDCAETEEYKQYKFLQGIHMGDTVKVIAKRVGVEVAMRMTQYSYDCLTRKYTKMTLGTIDATIEGNMINPRSIGSGTIKGSMIKLNSIGTGQIMDGAVNGLKIALAAIDYAHIGTAAIDQLAVNAVTAIRAEIRELVAGNITTDQLYADLAVIAAAQITAANIEKANIQWAQIATLTAAIAEIANAEIARAEIDWAQIKNAQIDAADITNLTAAVAVIVKAEIALAEIDWAQIKNVEVGTAQIKLGAITQALIAAGAIGTAQIADGSITDAKIVSLNADVITSGTLSTERLLIKGAGGLFYEINATAGGLTSTQLNEEQYKNAISGTALVAKSVTAAQIAAKTITANEILSGTITAAEINVANLFAADATIAALDNYILRTQTIEAIEGQLEVWANEKIRLAVDNIQIGGRNLLKNTAELKKADWSFDNSSTSAYNIAMGTVTENEAVGGLDVVCSNANVRWWLGGFAVTPGQKYAVSVRYKRSSGESPINFQYVYQDASLAATGDYRNSSETQTTRIEDGWTILSDVLTVPDKAQIANVRLALRVGADNTAYTVSYTYCKPKFEAGTRATDWTPAPEDSELAVKTLEAELSVQAGKISANAAKIETVNQSAADAQSKADANAADLTAVTKRVTTAEANISALDGKISTKVEKTEFDDLGNIVSQQGTKIEQTDEQVLILAGQKIGGTNLIRIGTDDLISLTVGTLRREGGTYYQRSGLLAQMQPHSGTYNILAFKEGVKVHPGSYMLSFWCWTDGIDVQPTVRCNLLNMDSTRDHYFKDVKPTANTPVRYEIPVEVTYTDTMRLRFVVPTQWTAGSLFFSDVKLEEGDKATAWSPSPDDPAGSVNAGGVVRVDQTGVHLSGGVVEMEASDGDEFIRITNSSVTASSLEAPNVAKRYAGPSSIIVKPDATSAQIAAGGYFKSLPEAFTAVSNRYLDKSVTITVQGDSYGDALLTGVNGSGSVTVQGGGYGLIGTMTIRDCGSRVFLYGLTVSQPSTSTQTRAMWIANARYVAMESGVIISGNGGTYAMLIEWGSVVWLYGVELYNAVNLMYCIYGTHVTCLGLKGGGCTYFAWANGCILKMAGTRPDGSLRTSNAALLVPTDPTTLPISYGTAQPSVPVVQTAAYNYLHSDSYRGGWSWFSDEDVRQGYISSGAIYGVIWFDQAAIKAALNGKTINQASLRLHMHSGVGRGSAVSVQLYGTNTAYTGRSGAPAITASYGDIGSTNPGEVAEITIPAQAIKDLVSGTICALVLKSDDTELYKDRDYSRNYARFSGSTSATTENCPRLTVVYQ